MTTLRRRARSPIDAPSEAWTDAHLVLLAHLIGDGCHLKRQSSSTRRPIPPTSKLSEPRPGRPSASPPACSGSGAGTRSTSRPTAAGAARRNPIAAWLDELGLFDKRSWEKFVPASVFGLGRASIALFLRHLWATDGSLTLPRSGQPRIYYAPSSRQLAIDVQSLLLRLGIVARVGRIRPARWSRPAPGRHLGSRRTDGVPRPRRLPRSSAARRSRPCGPSSSLGGPTPTST